MSEYTITITDEFSILSDATKASMNQNAEFVVAYIDRFLDWRGTLDVELNIRPLSELNWSDADGLLPANGQISWTGTDWSNDTLHEMLTGEDRDTSRADTGALIFVPDGGVVKNYGATVWFDPNPQFEVAPKIPAGAHDFVSILTHEMFHTFALYSATVEYRNHVLNVDGTDYFTGENTVRELGENLQLGAPYADGPADHYVSPSESGLMNHIGNYEQNRWDISRIDLAILQDLGHDVSDFDGIALFDIDDKKPDLEILGNAQTLFGDFQDNVLTGNSGANEIIGNAGNDTIYGLAGNDRISGGRGNDFLSGAGGIDTALFSNNIEAYSISKEGSGLTVTDIGNAEIDTLVDIERLRFSDVGRAFDLDANAGDVAKVLGALLGPEGVNNKGYVGIGLEHMDNGSSYEQLMEVALAAILGTDPQSDAVINLLYKNLTGLAAPDALLNEFGPLLDNGSMNSVELAIAAADHELNAANINLVGLADRGLEFV